MKKIIFDSSFKRQLKRIEKKHYSLEEFRLVLKILVSGEQLPRKYHDHALSGNYKTCRDCHIQPDWILIYRTTENELFLVATGSHDEIFK